jgi:hypothetical protein
LKRPCKRINFFGITSLFEGLSGHSLLSFSHESKINVTGPFGHGMLPTASNPLAILFWSGLFAAKTAEKKLTSTGPFPVRRRYGYGHRLLSGGSRRLRQYCSAFFTGSHHQILKSRRGSFFYLFAVKLGLKRNKN